MGTLTAEELTEEVRSHLGERDDLDDRILRYLNFSQIRLARAYSFPELHRASSAVASFTGTSAEDRFLNLPTDTRSVKSLVLLDGTTSKKIDYIPPRQFDKEFSGYIERGRRKPQIYTKWQEYLELMPLPEQQYEYDLRWVKWPADLVAGTTSELDRKDELLILLTGSIANHSLARYDRGKELYGMAMTLLGQAVQDEELEPDEEIKPLFETAKGREEYWTNPFIKGVS